MKRVLPYRNLSEREVPEGIDCAILSYAAQRCRPRRIRRTWLCFGGIAAAICLAAFPCMMWQIRESRSVEQRELLAMGDFSRLDQSSFNMTLELAASGDFSSY